VNKVFKLFFLILILGCTTIYNPATQRKESYFISETQEITIGKNISHEIIQKNRIISNRDLKSYLENMGQKIARASHRNHLNYNFSIVDDNEINAFALPGGYIFINKGLIDKMDEDELAFVIAHEIGHICARHSLKKLQSSFFMSLVMGLASSNPDYASVRTGVNAVYNVVALGYSRSDELLADSLGLEYMHKAEYNPQGAIDALEKLKAEGGKNKSLVFLRSHPYPEDRIEKIKEKVKSLKN